MTGRLPNTKKGSPSPGKQIAIEVLKCLAPTESQLGGKREQVLAELTSFYDKDFQRENDTPEEMYERYMEHRKRLNAIIGDKNTNAIFGPESAIDISRGADGTLILNIGSDPQTDELEELVKLPVQL